MLGAQVALQRFPDRLLARLDVWITQTGEYRRIPFAGDDGFQCPQAREARNVIDDMLNLHVHLRRRLVHVLDILADHLNPVVSAPIGERSAHTRHLAGTPNAEAPSSADAESADAHENRCAFPARSSYSAESPDTV
jgi:hypothetical protein